MRKKRRVSFWVLMSVYDRLFLNLRDGGGVMVEESFNWWRLQNSQSFFEPFHFTFLCGWTNMTLKFDVGSCSMHWLR